MKKIKNKGFTLTEILAVITILTIIALLVTTGIMGYLKKGKEGYNNKLKNQLVLASKTYYAEHKEELPTTTNGKGYAYITLPAMQSNNYVNKSFIDSDGRECSPSYVYVKQKTNNPNEYEYHPCLICQDKKGNEKVYSDSEEEQMYCDPANWHAGEKPVSGGDGPNNPPQPDDDSSCEFVRDGSDITVTEATMSTGILRIYYVDGGGVEHLIWPPEGVLPQVTVRGVEASDVGNNDRVYMEDNYENIIECNETDNPTPTPTPTPSETGAPTCTFVNVPTNWIKSVATFQVVCQGQNGASILLNNSKKITANTSSYGTFTSSISSTTDTKITFNLKFTPKSSTEGRTTITVGEGTVKNKNNSKVNATISTAIKSDTKAPTLSFTASGTKGNATAKKDKGAGYKNKVTVKITCSDSGSGVSVFKVKIGSGDYTTVSGTTYTDTRTSRGTYKYTAYCKDAAGNEKTTSQSYRVLKSSASCSKCGAAKTKCVKQKCSYYYKWCCHNASICREHGHPSDMANGCGNGCTTIKWDYIGGTAYSYHKCSSCSCTKTECTKGKTCWY